MEEKNRRCFPRITLKTPLHYKVRGTTRFDNTISNDISVGGLGFSNNEFIAPNTILNFELNILSRIIRPSARVAWAVPIPHSDRCKMGVEFLEMEPEEKGSLTDYINIRSRPF
ncbi:MAG: PilZ domain-containing protein [Candidatus Omnitrophica bacterium]|nr:PilZ domain-containing protein [Candidatus Omnitrophota bacterium]